MRADDHRLIALPRQGGNDTSLAPRVREYSDEGAAVVRGGGVGDGPVDAAVQPGRGLGAVVGLVVAGMEGGELLEVAVHVLFGEVLHHRREGGVVCGFGGVLDVGFGCGREEAEFGRGGDVHEVEAGLEEISREGGGSAI